MIFPSLTGLTQAFVGPAMKSSLTALNQYQQFKMAMQTPYVPPPPEEPYQYLPPPGPYSTGAGWEFHMESFTHMLGLSGVFLGIGALLGVSVSLCSGRREKGEEEPQIYQAEEDLILEEEAEEEEKENSLNEFLQWAEEHFESSEESASDEQAVEVVNEVDFPSEESEPMFKIYART